MIQICIWLMIIKSNFPPLGFPLKAPRFPRHWISWVKSITKAKTTVCCRHPPIQIKSHKSGQNGAEQNYRSYRIPSLF